MAELRSGRPQLRLTLPPRPLEEVLPGGPDEAPFFRPKSRTRVRRARRGLLGRGVLALQLVGAAVALLCAAWAGYAQVMASDKLRVAHVEVRGQRFLSEGEVLQLLGPALGENILTLELKQLKAKLRASPWVEDATVKRTLPDTLYVEIRERVPLALAEVDRLYLMDGDGTLIDIYGPRTANFDLPIVRGLQKKDGEARRGRAERAGALLRDLQDLAAEISEVQVEDSGDLRLVLRGQGEVLIVAEPPYRGLFLTYLGLRRELQERCPNAEYFDLRFKDRIYTRERVTPSPKPSAAAAGALARGGEPARSRPAPATSAEPLPQATGASPKEPEAGRPEKRTEAIGADG
jgi:cell division septal protein FtsQ